MNKHLISNLARVLASALLGGLVLTAAAQDVDPGLWEFRVQMNSPDGSNPLLAQMQEQLKSMPPEMQQMMQQQMASMGMGMGGEAMTLKHCVTPEEAQKGPIQEGQTDGDCTYTQVKQKGKTWTGQMTCTEDDMKGEFTTTLHSRRHYTTEADMTSASTGRMLLKNEARWVAADCGGQGQ